MSPRVLRFVYLFVFLFLYTLFAALLGPGTLTPYVAPFLAGITTVAISYGVRAWLIRRNGA